jgi:hypothetical protein
MSSRRSTGNSILQCAETLDALAHCTLQNATYAKLHVCGRTLSSERHSSRPVPA